MTTGGAGLAAGLIAGTGPAPGPGRPLFPSGQGTGLVPPPTGAPDAAILPSAYGEVLRGSAPEPAFAP